MTDKKILQKQFEQVKFASNPTEERGIMWRWTKEGKEVLVDFIFSLQQETRREIEKKYKKSIIGGNVRTGCCDAEIRVDEDDQLWCMNCGRKMGGVIK